MNQFRARLSLAVEQVDEFAASRFAAVDHDDPFGAGEGKFDADCSRRAAGAEPSLASCPPDRSIPVAKAENPYRQCFRQ
jgi:hypothetical protein